MEYPSRDCLKLLHAAKKHAGEFSTKHGKFREHTWKHFVGSVQHPLFELKLKTFPLLHRRDLSTLDK